MKKVISIIFLITLSSFSTAEQFWTAPVKVESLSAFYHSNKSNYVSVKGASTFTRENGAPIPTSCSITNNENIVGYGTESSISSTIQVWYSTLLNAQNLGKPVQIWLTTSCSTIVGMKLQGVRIYE